MAGYFHIGLLVPDIDAAIEELGPLLEVEWRPVHQVALELGTGIDDRHPRLTKVTFTTGGPPAIELFEWEPLPDEEPIDRPVVHHIGRWVDDLPSASARLAGLGCPLALTVPGADGGPTRFALHQLSFGLQVELVDVTIPRPSMAGLQP